MTTTSEFSAVDRMLDAVCSCLDTKSAQQLVELRADAGLQLRLEHLAEKSTAGALSEAECAECETYIRLLDFIAILQTKASRLLREKSGP